MTLTALLEALLVYFPHPALLPFLGAFLGGEETIILISMLSAGGLLSFKYVVIASYVGTMTSDALWFLFGRRFLPWLEKKPKMSKGFTVASAFVDKVTKGNQFLALLITKFLYGTRLIMIFYFGREKMSFKKFVAYNSIVTAIWIGVICPLGWLAGVGIIDLIKTFKNVEVAFAVFVLGAFLFYGIRIWLNRTIIENKA